MGLMKKKKKPLRTRGAGASSGGGKGAQETPYRPVQKEKTPPCMVGCPNGTKIREIIRAIAETEDRERSYDDSYKIAYDLLMERNPFPASCGRVCPHPCEGECNRQNKSGEGEGSVAINSIERFIGDWAIENNLPVDKLSDETYEEKIAIIGAGPAGLSAAYQLARQGYQNINVYEAFSKGGGMMRYGIPDYRLPPEVLDAEINRIEKLGVNIHYNTMIGKDIPYEKLQEENDAIFVGIGAHKGKSLRLEHEDAPNVWTGTLFLNQVNSDNLPDVGDKVLVVGGGDTAIDAARVSKRLGADVTVVYRRTRNEMPAIEEEIVGAEEEGINFYFLAAPNELIVDDSSGNIVKMKCEKMELGEPDDSGRRRPVPTGEYFELDCTTVIPAISQEPDFDNLENLHEGKDWVKADDGFKTPLEKTYAGGDALDLGLVTIAIFQGRKAADTIHNNFRGIQPEPEEERPVVTQEQIVYSYYTEKARHEALKIPPDERLKSLEKEISCTLTAEEVNDEALRCMSCGSCFDCGTCWSLCQDQVFVKPPTKQFQPYKMKLDLCKGCMKCAENCPCGFIEMQDPATGEFAKIERVE